MKRGKRLLPVMLLVGAISFPYVPYNTAYAVDTEESEENIFEDYIETTDKTASAVRKDINQTFTFKSVNEDEEAVGNVKIRLEYKPKGADESEYQTLKEITTDENGEAEYTHTWEYTTPEKTFTYTYFTDLSELSGELLEQAEAKCNSDEYWWPSLENLDEQWESTIEARKQTELRNEYVKATEIDIRYQSIEAPEGYKVSSNYGEVTVHINDDLTCISSVMADSGEDPDPDPNPTDPLTVEKKTKTFDATEEEVEVSHKITAKEINTNKLLANVPIEVYAKKEGTTTWEKIAEGKTDSKGEITATLKTTLTIPEQTVEYWGINREYNPETEIDEYNALEEQYETIIFPEQYAEYEEELYENAKATALHNLKSETKYEYKVVNTQALAGYDKGSEIVFTKPNGSTLSDLYATWDISYYLKPAIPTYKVTFNVKSAATKNGIKGYTVTITDLTNNKVKINAKTVNATSFSISWAQEGVNYKYTIKGPTGYLTATGTFKVSQTTIKTVYLNEVQPTTGKITPTKQNYSFTSKCTITTKGSKTKKAVKGVKYTVYRKYAGSNTKFVKLGNYTTDKNGNIAITTKHSGSFTLASNYNYYTNYSSLTGVAKQKADANIKTGKWFKTRAEADAKYKADIKAKKDSYGKKLYTISIKQASVPSTCKKNTKDQKFNVYVKTANSKKSTTVTQK